MYDLTTLGNGLRILTVTMPHLQSVSLGFFLRVGSRYESETMSGASHFIEHMLFKGTTRRPTAHEIAEAIEGKGGVFNASTGLEMTLYWAKVAAQHLPEALDVLSDMLLHPAFDPEEVEKERAVINEEIGYALDAPDAMAQILANRLQWPDHPLGRDIAGTRSSVAAISRESLLSYLADHYRPGEALLGLAGRVDHKEAIAQGRAFLADWEPGPSMLWDPAPPNYHGPSIHVEHRNSEQAHLVFSFCGLSRSDPGRYVLRLLNIVLGEGMRSRLFQEVRERLGLAYSIDSYISALHDTGAVGIYAGVAADRVEEAIRAIVGQLARLQQEPIAEQELEKAKEFYKGRQALALEDSFAVASWYARQMLLGPEVVDPVEVVHQFERVQAAEIQAMAQTLFQPARLNLAVVGPFAEVGERFRELVQF